MIKRIDIRKINGEWTLMDECPRNWIIEILEDKQQIRAIGLSRATEKDPNFYFPLVEGSLFLRNHTFNFYAFFREKAEQQIMDTFGILKVVVLEENKKDYIHITEVNMDIMTPIVYMRGVDIVDVKNMDFELQDDSKTMRTSMVKVKFNDERGFIIQKCYNRNGRDKHFIFIPKKVKLSDILSEKDKGNLLKVNTRSIMRMGV